MFSVIWQSDYLPTSAFSATIFQTIKVLKETIIICHNQWKIALTKSLPNCENHKLCKIQLLKCISEKTYLMFGKLHHLIRYTWHIASVWLCWKVAKNSFFYPVKQSNILRNAQKSEFECPYIPSVSFNHLNCCRKSRKVEVNKWENDLMEEDLQEMPRSEALCQVHLPNYAKKWKCQFLHKSKF